MESLEVRSLLSSVTVDLGTSFNVDGIANHEGGADDLGDGVDASGGLLSTDAWATAQSEELGNGLPDDGFFPATLVHPRFDFGDLNRSGNNLLQMHHSVQREQYTIDVPEGQYYQLDLAAFGAEGDAGFRLTLAYEGKYTEEVQTEAADWFSDVADGSVFGDAVRYTITDGMDRFDGFNQSYHNANAAAVFGHRFEVDPTRTLRAIYVERTLLNDDSYLNITGLTLQEVPDFQPLVVSTTSDVVDGEAGPGQLSLREAVHYANLRPGEDHIVFAPAPYGPQGFQTYSADVGAFHITDDLRLTGSGPDATLLTGRFGHSLIQVGNEGAAAGAVEVRMEDLRLWSNDAPGRAGGLLNFVTVTAERVEFSNLTAYAPEVEGPRGGAIYNAGNLTL